MVESSRDEQWNVLELSSFQLETIRTFRAHVAMCLNVTQNHLDRHYTFEQYAEAKGESFAATAGDHAVLNADDPVCRRSRLTRGKRSGSAERRFIGRRDSFGWRTAIATGDVPIPGHAQCARTSWPLWPRRISRGSNGRDRRGGKDVSKRWNIGWSLSPDRWVKFYNDSKATSVDATMKALDSFARIVDHSGRQG